MTRVVSNFLLGGFFLALACLPTRAEDPSPTEAQVKAAYIYNFAKFVQWPAGVFQDTNSPIIIDVAGDRPFSDELDRTLRDKTVDGRKLVVKSVRNPGEMASCQILFVGADEKGSVRKILDAVRSSSVLTVADAENFTQSGGMIHFVMDGKRVRFEINSQEVHRARLKISPRLLKLAVNHPEAAQ